MKPRVWIEVQMHPDALTRLAPHAEIIVGGKRDQLPGSDALILGGTRVDAAFLDEVGPNLKCVVRFGIGYDAVNLPAASERGVLVANTPDGPTEGTAEHAVGLMLAVAKGINMSDRVLHSTGNWAQSKARGIELKGRTLGLVGYGRIGQRVAEICALGLGMNVLFLAPNTRRFPELSHTSRIQSLNDLLEQADVISLHPRLDSTSHHLLGESELRRMKKDAILINTSRGEIIDEAALLRVLQDGHLRGVGLDVFDPEPSPHDNPLYKFANVIVTPHVGSFTTEGNLRMSMSSVDQILQVFAGEKPNSLINEVAWPGRLKRAAGGNASTQSIANTKKRQG